MKRVILLGSTGSIGRNAIAVIKKLKGFRIVGIAAYSNRRLLLQQAKNIKPEVVTLIEDTYYRNLKKNLERTHITCGEEGITEMVESARADIIICALSSSIGIYGILRAIEKKMRICLATKEILVSFGDIIMQKLRRHNALLIPIDSEHSAIYQCLEGKNIKDVLNIFLTASGGPFLNKTTNNVKKSDVLRHPVWKMGKKITVDSATMMNKGLEVIEAHHLFHLPANRIKVVIHPQALCHSLVQFIDGTLLAQVSTPDMKLPIQYALTAPHRFPAPVKYLDIKKVDTLNFQAPDFKKFPCLELAYDALSKGKSTPAVLNAANAQAVKFFLEDKLEYNGIPKIIRKVITKHIPKKGSIDEYVAAEKWAKDYTKSLIC